MTHTNCRVRRTTVSGAFRIGALVLGLMAQPVLGQTDPAAYPRQPIKLLIGFAAGGGNDLIARIVAQKLGERFGQPVVVENKPGAGANIAAEFVSRAAPDGYTLLVLPPATCCINPAVYSKLPYDPLKSFDYVTIIAHFPILLAVSADSPHRSLKDLVDWSKANPKAANYASTSAFFQLLTELFKARTGAPFEHIPFKGSNEMMTAVLSGQVSMAFIDASALIGQVKAGKARVLATAGTRRYDELPDVPTLVEAGVEGVVVDGWSGLAAPKGTPQPILDRLAAEIATIVKLPDVEERFRTLGVAGGGGTPEPIGKRVLREMAVWTEVAKAANIKLD